MTTSLLLRSKETLRPGRSNPPALMFQPQRSRVLPSLVAGLAQNTKVLAIVAPVGYGKTVLMTLLHDELRRASKKCLWYTLDDRDISVEGIVSALEAQLSLSQANLHPTQALFRGEDPIERRIEGLMQLVDTYPLPLTVFIDNLNCCTDPALRRLIDQLAFYSRSSIQLVLSSTRDIPFDSSRAELQGMLQRLGPEELAFDNEDIDQFLGPTLSQKIGQAGIEAIARRTEGWPAAVRMMQIILSNAKQPDVALASFSGSDTALTHLLNQQVLSGFSDELREFVFCVAQLRSFNLEMCREVIGKRGVERHLAYLIERNIFVIPLDRNRNWHRLHGLFRDFLLREASQALPPSRIQNILIRAARWNERHGYWRDAMDYALASGSGPTATEILEHIAPTFVRDRGHVQQYLRWIDALIEQGHEPGAEAEYWYVWALAFHRRFDQARQQARGLVARIQRQRSKVDASKREELLRRIAILKSSIDSLSDHPLDAFESATRWLSGASAAQSEPFNLTAAHCIQGFYHFSMFRFVEARRSLQAAHESAFQTGSIYVDGWVATYTALATLHEGEFASAYQDIMPVLTAARAALGEEAGICGTMAMVAAKCAMEMGHNAEAAQLVESGFKTASSHGFLDAIACGLEVGVLLWNGAEDHRSALTRLHEIASCYPPRLSYMLSCYLIQRLIVLNKFDQAREEAERIGLFVAAPLEANSPGGELASMAALIEDTVIALMMASGRLSQAEHAIDNALRGARTARCAMRQVMLSLEGANVALRSGQTHNAVRYITRAVNAAAPRGIIRPFNDQIATLGAVVADTKLSAWGFAIEAERQFFADRCRQLTFADSATQERLASLHSEEAHLTCKLTARELELLSYIEAGLSNQQIADRIDVALTTVKWHLKNLFAKLSVPNRSAALAKARILNLL